jgi:K+ transporter
MGSDADLYGWELFGFKSHGFAAVGKAFIPCYIVIFAFMAVYHISTCYTRVYRLYFKVDLKLSIH